MSEFVDKWAPTFLGGMAGITLYNLFKAAFFVPDMDRIRASLVMLVAIGLLTGLYVWFALRHDKRADR